MIKSIALALLALIIVIDTTVISQRQHLISTLRDSIIVQQDIITTQEETITLLKSRPKPATELIVSSMQEAGFTNVVCLVYGEKDGITLGCLMDSNRVVTVGEIKVKVVPASAEKVSQRL